MIFKSQAQVKVCWIINYFFEIFLQFVDKMYKTDFVEIIEIEWIILMYINVTSYETR